MSEPLTAAMLSGTPVGTPEGDVICDSCNKMIATARQLRAEQTDDEEEATTVHVYATCGAGRWALRWTNCTECGPLGDGEATEPGEAHATASLMLHPNRETTVILVDATIIACSPPA
jgi:hypothetical protein